MYDQNVGPFGIWAEIYRDLGMWPRPLVGKAPKEKNWQLPDPELPEGTIEKWDAERADFNIGLVAGSPFPDGTLLGFLDIDNDLYVRLGKALLGNPKCARLGKKGMVFPVRYTPDLKTGKKMRVKGEENEHWGEVAEFLFAGSLCAIPPSIHPDTNRPYEWIGIPLHKIDFNDLPLIGE